MPRLDTPTVLITRPKANSDDFVDALRRVSGPFHALISPAFELEGVKHTMPEFEVAIFSSRAAVRFAPQGRGRLAYCVGDATSHDAMVAGYKSVSAKGAFDDLISLILDRRPDGRILHMRGETTVGDLRGALSDAGLPSNEVVTYRKVKVTPTEAVKYITATDEALLLPVFSAETVSIISGWGCEFAHAHVIAISPAVATMADRLSPASISIAQRPDQAAMIAAVARMIA